MVFGLLVVNLQNQASFYTRKMFGVVVSFIGIFKSGDLEKTRGWQCLLFLSLISRGFLELLPTSCGPFNFSFSFTLVVVSILLHCCHFLAEPSPTHNFNFPECSTSHLRKVVQWAKGNMNHCFRFSYPSICTMVMSYFGLKETQPNHQLQKPLVHQCHFLQKFSHSRLTQVQIKNQGCVC